MAVGTMAAAPRPCRPRNTSKPISLGTKGTMMDVMVTQAEPQMKIRRLP